ncbi:MAG TPA: DEAD/DEAH box helicase [Candidatus Limnocylindrales bacterium]|nr:DEAD/DEAH box helicase [Candidatus Limnocylindrales bacterium]
MASLQADRSPTIEPTDGFGLLGLDERLLATLTELGYEEPTPIQRAAIPPLLEGRDLLAEAPTGTGKTAAFALPALQRLAAGRGAGSARPDGHPSGLVLVPTRELAIQVSEAIHRYGERLGVRVLPVYGGQAIGAQLRSLRRGVDLVVATPGRAIDHLKRGTLTLDRIEVVVLDEADEMLDMGFAEDLETLLSGTPDGRQTALFSATISGPIARIAHRHLRDPARVTIQADRRAGAGVAGVRQVAYVVRRSDKLTALGRILDVEDPASALVFARTRGEVDELAERLSGRGRDAAALHGGLSQEQRDRIMGRFRAGELDVLVATDVAARGLDIERVSHVVNYDIPSNPDVYVHRIGRTGRAGRAGVAITLVEPREHRLLANIERHVGVRLEVTPVPTAADLQERRSDALRSRVRAALADEDRDRVRQVIEPLLSEFDAVDVAIAAVGVAERAIAGDGVDEADVERVELGDRPKRAARPAPVPARRGHMPLVHRDRRPGGPGPGGAAPGPGGRWTRLFVGAGRKAGLRPGDLVGAITGETRVTGKSVGAIQIADSYSLVEVPDHAADEIVRALSSTTIKGRRLPVRRERPREP